MSKPSPYTGDVPHSRSLLSTSRPLLPRHVRLLAITGYIAVTYLAWSIVQVVAHSFAFHPLLLQNLTNDSTVVFLTQGEIIAGSLFAAWYAECANTQAARVGNNVVSVFVAFTWIFDLPFIYQVLNGDADYGNNYYCHGYIDPDTSAFSQAGSGWCGMAKASAAMAIIEQVGQLLLVLHSLYTTATLPSDELDQDPNDAQMADIEKRPENAGRAKLRTVAIKVTLLIAAFGFVGYLLLVLSYTDILTLIPEPSAQDPSPFSPNPDYVDPVLYDATRSLPVLFAFSFTLTIYAIFRYKRALTASAILLTASTFYILWGTYVWYCRRVSYGPTNQDHLASQKGAIVGLGFLLFVQTVRSLSLAVVYAVTFPMDRAARLIANQRWLAGEVAEGKRLSAEELRQRSEDAPQYPLGGALRNVHPLLVALHVLYAAVVFTAFVISVVTECLPSIFTQLTTSPVLGAVYSNVVMILNSHVFQFMVVFWVGAAITTLYASRIGTVSTAFASLCVNAIIFATWWVVTWPATFQSLYAQAETTGVVCPAADAGLIEQNYCRVAKAAAVVSCVQQLVQALVTVYAAFHLLSFLLPRTRARFVRYCPNAPLAALSFLSYSTLTAGVFIFGLGSVSNGTQPYASDAIQVPDNSYLPNAISGSVDPTYPVTAYYVNCAFILLVPIAFAVWFGVVASTSHIGYHRMGVRYLGLGLNALVLAMIAPTFVLSCRFLNHYGDELSASLKAMASGVIVCAAGVLGGCVTTAIGLFCPRDPIVADSEHHTRELLHMDADGAKGRSHAHEAAAEPYPAHQPGPASVDVESATRSIPDDMEYQLNGLMAAPLPEMRQQRTSLTTAPVPR